MNPQRALRDLLEQWREITRLEGEAIRLSHWTKVIQCQHRKRELQAAIDRLRSHAEGLVDEPALKAIAQDLIGMEEHNAHLFAEQRERAVAEKNLIENAAKNLRRVHSAYTFRRDSLWNSYG